MSKNTTKSTAQTEINAPSEFLASTKQLSAPVHFRKYSNKTMASKKKGLKVNDSSRMHAPGERA